MIKIRLKSGLSACASLLVLSLFLLNNLASARTIYEDDSQQYIEAIQPVLSGRETSDEIDPDDEDQAEIDINEMEAYIRPYLEHAQNLDWVANTDYTEENSAAAGNAYTNATEQYFKKWEEVINVYNYENFTNPLLKRRFARQAKPGTAALPAEKQTELNEALSEMNSYSLRKICPFDKQDCNTDKYGLTMDELEIVMAQNRKDEELEYYWVEWRDTAGKPSKRPYLTFVDLMNEAAEMEVNGFENAGQMWLKSYEADGYSTEDFKSEIDELWAEVEDLYSSLHAYVRYRLRKSDEYYLSFGEHSPIPAHILGNMWAQSWENIYDLVVPYKDVPLLDISEALEENVKNVTEMFDHAEEFFTSIGMFSMTENFDKKSMFEQPGNKTAVCHASAWDFMSDMENPQENGDYRIKMCTDKNQEDFIVIHHEMGHTEYQMAYSEDVDGEVMPPIFRDGANPGFHEAIGDTIALSVSTPDHLEILYSKITGETYNVNLTAEEVEYRNINQLMKTALAKVAFVPYAYILDKFRWEVFEGKHLDELNYWWWDKRVKIQGLKPPVPRYKSEDFDIGCKFHVANGIPYIRYFVAHILQFQFHEKLCEIQAEADGVPLNSTFLCSIYESKEAGAALKSLLVKGATEDWTDQLAEFLDAEGRMNASAMVNYFAPLKEFLDEEIEKHGISKKVDHDVEDYFVQDIPATVPIVVGIVLVCMIAVVVVAFFVGKRRQAKKEGQKEGQKSVNPAAEVDNPAFEADDKKSQSSSDSD